MVLIQTCFFIAWQYCVDQSSGRQSTTQLLLPLPKKLQDSKFKKWPTLGFAGFLRLKLLGQERALECYFNLIILQMRKWDEQEINDLPEFTMK